MNRFIQKHLKSLWNFWPPFFFSGIKIISCTPNYQHIVVQLKLRFWNKNFVGTLYGGSLFSMADPFYMVMLIKNLGSSYSVWDKSASISYLKPGRSDVTAEFNVTEEDLILIRTTLAQNEKMDWSRVIEIVDSQGTLIAKVQKTISIKKK